MCPTDGFARSGNRSLVYDALADDRRRRVLGLLDDADAALTIDELAERLAECEGDQADESEVAVESVDDAAFARLRTSLYHVHVPKLSEAGIVRFSPDSQRVRLTGSVCLDTLDAVGS